MNLVSCGIIQSNSPRRSDCGAIYDSGIFYFERSHNVLLGSTMEVVSRFHPPRSCESVEAVSAALCGVAYCRLII